MRARRTLLASLLAACAPAAGGSPDATLGGPADASAPADGSMARDAGPAPDASAELGRSCGAACAAAEPGPGHAPPECATASVSDCKTACTKAVAGTDAVCARCLIDGLAWREASGYCSSWECVCSDGYPRFPGTSGACAEPCAATLARWAAERIAAPVPEATGHQPRSVHELDGVAAITRLARAGAGGYWATVTGSPGASSWAQVARLSGSLALDWQGRPPDAFGGGYVAGLHAVEGGAVALLADGQGSARLVRYQASSAAPVWSLDVSAAAPALPFATLTARDDGRVLLGTSGYEVAWASADGATLGPRSALPLTVPAAWNAQLAALALLPGGALISAGTPNTGAQLALFDPAPSGAGFGSARYEQSFASVPAPGPATLISAVAVDPSGHVAVVGGSHYERKNGRISSFATWPFVARVAPDGGVLWRWDPPALPIVSGQLADVTTDAAGNLYVVGTEDPSDDTLSTADPACTVYGCDGLVVRKFSPDGSLRWEYAHRSATSHGFAIALADDGDVIAAGSVTRETTEGLVLRFAAE